MAYGRAGNSPYPPPKTDAGRWPSWSRQASGATHRGQEFPGRHHPLREKGLRVPRHRHDRSDPVPASALSELNPSVLTPWRRATSRQTKKPDKCRQTMAAARSSGRRQPNRRAGASSQGATDASSESWPRWPIGSRNFPPPVPWPDHSLRPRHRTTARQSPPHSFPTHPHGNAHSRCVLAGPDVAGYLDLGGCTMIRPLYSCHTHPVPITTISTVTAVP